LFGGVEKIVFNGDDDCVDSDDEVGIVPDDIDVFWRGDSSV
jgi:hypothetical protein